jgi:hypothetical protein
LGKARFKKEEGKSDECHPDYWAPTNCFSLKSHELIILSVGFLPSRMVQIESEGALAIG